jgi:hypothetical protein
MPKSTPLMRFTLRSKLKVDVQWTRTRFALVAQARNIGKIPHLWCDPLTPDGVKYAFDARNWSLHQLRVRMGSLKNQFFDSLVGQFLAK